MGKSLFFSSSRGGILALLILTAGLFSPLFASEEQIISSGDRMNPRFENMILRGTRIATARDGTQIITLKKLKQQITRDTLLILDFDNQLPHLLQDETRNYRIDQSHYTPIASRKDEGYSALFSNPEHRIVIEHGKGLWPSPEIEAFTIHFRIKPNRFFKTNSLLKKVSYLDGIKRGLEIGIEDQRVYLDMENILVDPDGGYRSFLLKSTETLEAGKWTDVSISVNPVTGMVALYIDRKEDSIDYTKDSTGAYRIRFHPLDRSPLIIAENFSGLLDDFIIEKGSVAAGGADRELPARGYPSLHYSSETGFFSQERAEAISPVIALSKQAKTGRARIQIQTQIPEQTGLTFFVRTSPTPFSADAPRHQIPWIKPGKEKYLTGSFGYIQWKAVLKSDPGGRLTPALNSVRITYQDAETPVRPSKPIPIPGLVTSESVVLSWEKNPELSVQNQGGYVLYYGVEPDRFTGKIVIPSDSHQLTNPLEARGRSLLSKQEKQALTRNPGPFRRRVSGSLRFQLTNQVISGAIYRDERQRPMPFLKKGYTYYFAIAAYNESGGESDLSEQSTVTLPNEE